MLNLLSKNNKKYISITYGNPFLPKGCIVEAFKLTKEFISDKINNNISEEKFGKLDIRYDSNESILTLNVSGLGQHQRFKVEDMFGGRWFLRNIETNSTHVLFETEFIRGFKE